MRENTLYTRLEYYSSNKVTEFIFLCILQSYTYGYKFMDKYV